MNYLPFFGASTIDPVLVLGVSAGIVVVIFFLIIIAKMFLIVCPPNRVLVVSGRSDGSTGGKKGYRKAIGGRIFRIPILEQVAQMDLTTIPIHISVKNAYSKGGIALQVEAVANVKINSDPVMINNAIERFLGQDPSELRRAAQDTLEGNLREVLARLTPEKVNEDRLSFANELSSLAEEDLNKLGLHLDTLKIQHVSDSNNYLDSIGRQRIALILRDAEIAESNARREAENVAAEKRAEAQVVKENTEAEVARRRNELRQLKAELEAKAKAEEEKTIAAAKEARAKAEQDLQQIRSQLEALRLQADKVIPAEATRQAREMQAKATAAPIEENGKALAKALDQISTSWSQAGPQARDIFLIQQLEKILGIVVNTVNDMQVGQVHLIDNGDGKAIPNYVQSFPSTVAAIMHSLYDSIGIDIPSILRGDKTLTAKTDGENA
ncbi:MAG: flotillin family protein [Myxococcales bacterium]|nr:flotillin family protein [Myxococcales bacterium]